MGHAVRWLCVCVCVCVCVKGLNTGRRGNPHQDESEVSLQSVIDS